MFKYFVYYATSYVGGQHHRNATLTMDRRFSEEGGPEELLRILQEHQNAINERNHNYQVYAVTLTAPPTLIS